MMRERERERERDRERERERERDERETERERMRTEEGRHLSGRLFHDWTSLTCVTHTFARKYQCLR